MSTGLIGHYIIFIACLRLNLCSLSLCISLFRFGSMSDNLRSRVFFLFKSHLKVHVHYTFNYVLRWERMFALSNESDILFFWGGLQSIDSV